MFKQTAIFYITKSNIFLVSKKTALQKLDIKTHVVNQEVLNTALFIKSLSLFIEGQKIKNAKTLILIDESLTYEKEIEEKEITQQIIDQFSQELPFDDKELEIANIKTASKNILIATNKLIYQALIKALLRSGNKVEFVIPAKYASLHETDLQTLSFNSLLNKTTAVKIEEINFRLDEAALPEISQTPSEGPASETAEKKVDKLDANQSAAGQQTPENHSKTFIYLFTAIVVALILAGSYFLILGSK